MSNDEDMPVVEYDPSKGFPIENFFVDGDEEDEEPIVEEDDDEDPMDHLFG